MHDAGVHWGGGSAWAVCTCGWTSPLYRDSRAAFVEAARHMAEMEPES